jgi:RNA polymerase primary sigma factor
MVTPQKEIWEEEIDVQEIDAELGDQLEAELAEGLEPSIDEDAEPEAVELDRPAPEVERSLRDDSVASMYYREMGRYATLTAEQEVAMGHGIREARETIWKRLLLLPATRLYILEILRRDRRDAPLALQALEEASHVRSRARAHIEHLEKLAQKAGEHLTKHDPDEVWLLSAVQVLQHSCEGASAGARQLTRALAEALAGVTEGLDRLRRIKRSFVEANLRLVIAVARKYSNGPMALIDLIQEGNMGLMKAVDRFDPDRGYRFSTYAAWWIRHAVSRAAADKSRTVRLPVHFIEAYQQLLKIRKDLQVQLGRQPNLDEVADAMGITRRKADRIQSYLQEGSLSLDRPVNHEDARSFLDMLEDPATSEGIPAQVIHENENELTVTALYDALTPMEREIIVLRFGLGDSEAFTLKDIGRRFRLSRERIRQIQEHALCKLRQYFQMNEML